MAAWEELTKGLKSAAEAADTADTGLSKLTSGMSALTLAVKAYAAVGIGKAVRDIFTLTEAQRDQRLREIKTEQQRLEVMNEELANLHLHGEEREGQLRDAEEEIRLLQRSIQLKEARHRLDTVAHQNRVGLAILATELGFYRDTVNEARSLAAMLQQANTAYSARIRLTKEIYEVQARTGASYASIGESARALVGYGAELRGRFKENVEIVTMLKEGLGVSAEEGAAMVTTWTALKQDASKVADVVAAIAESTGLAAQKAARYAIEIGRGLRLLGPMKTDTTGIVAEVEKVAASIEELGGNADVAVRLYRQMLGGTAEGFMLRGRAGVNVQSMGSPEGAQRALEGLAKSIRSMITAAPQTEAYAAQIELAAGVHQMAAEDVTYFLEAMNGLRRELTPAQALQRAYTQQTVQLGKAWEQVREAFSSLYKRAMLPILEKVAPMVEGLAKFAKGLADSETTLTLVGTGLVIGLGAATVAFIRLTKASWDFAKSEFGFKPFKEMLKGVGPWLKGQTSAFSLRGIGKFFAGSGSLLRWGALGAAGAAGVGLGTLADKWLMGKPWWESIGKAILSVRDSSLATALNTKKFSSNYSPLSQVRRPSDLMRETAEELHKMILEGKSTTKDYEEVMWKAGLQSHLTTSVQLSAFQEGITRELSNRMQKSMYIERLREGGPVTAADAQRREQLVLARKTAEAVTSSAYLTKRLVDTNIGIQRASENRAKLEEEAERLKGWWNYFPLPVPSSGMSYGGGGAW